MKKYLSILLSTMLVLLTLLSSCGEASETKNSNDNSDISSSLSSEQTLDAILEETSSELSDETAAADSGESASQVAENAQSTAGTSGNSKSANSAAAAADAKIVSESASSASGNGNTSSVITKNPSSAAASSSKSASSSKTASSAASSKSSSAGDMGTFTMTDLNGNTANQTIFNNYKLTMVNVWATYCNPCIKEMPGINDVYNQVKGEGVNIIGVVSDGTGKLDTIKEIVNKTGATYPMYIPSSSMLQNSFMSNISVVPTTFFVDRNGNRVGSAISGSKTAEQWLKTVNEMLARVS